MNTSCTCGCCEGVESVVPQSVANIPGLSALHYRVGTHATFLETMIARLSSKELPQLAALRTRDPGDPAIALLDSWALVADVLTFYQERIANEGYLRTATERRSILELARLIGYTLRPGVASSVYLAYTLDEDFSKTPPASTATTILKGSRSQSIPGPGETAQSFETSDELDARSEWNNLQPRLTRPQLITLNTDLETDASTRDALFFEGISTNLNPGDGILIIIGDAVDAKPSQQILRLVESVFVDANHNRTEVTLQPDPTLRDQFAEVADTLTALAADAETVFAGSNVATKVANALRRPDDAAPDVPKGLLDLLSDSGSTPTPEILTLAQSTIPQIEEVHDLALKRNFTRLEPWINRVLESLNDLVKLGSVVGANNPQPFAFIESSAAVASPLGNLGLLLEPLSRPPSLQPAGPLRLARSAGQVFTPQSDVAAKILGAFRPAAAPLLYKAWQNAGTPQSQVEVDAFRIKAGLFANNFVGAPILPTQPGVLIEAGTVPDPNNQDKPVTQFQEPTLASAWDRQTLTLSLDAVYDKIIPGSWVAIYSPSAKVSITYRKVQSVKTTTVKTENSAPGFSARVTQLTFESAWDPSNNSNETLRKTVVYAQAEDLTLSEEPLDIDIEDDTIELDGIYDGLVPGRWIIVSGERTDIPNVSGVKAGELVMIAGVEQGIRALFSAEWPADQFAKPPFASVSYITQPNKFGDRLVVGKLAVDISFLKPPSGEDVPPNQLYSHQIEIAPGLWVNAYVQGTREFRGDFPDFQGLLVDPATGGPIAGGILGQGVGSLWAWRISAAKPHTILTLAEKLAYSYDLNSVSIYGNVVKATHGETRNEVLGSGDASQAFQQFPLKQSPLTFVSAANPSGTETSLQVYVNDVEWLETDTLAALTPKDRNFITKTDDAVKTTVVFGDGKHGARLPTAAGNVKAIYRTGIGKPGNVNAEQISLLQTRPLHVKAVINPLRASGGADRDSRDQARRNAPVEVLALDRIVSVRDYADFARRFAGISKASANRLSDGRRQMVHVTIAGNDDIPIDVTSDLYRNLIQAYSIEGDPYEPVRVDVRRLKLLVVAAQVRILPEYIWESVVTHLRSTLLDAFGFDARDLGQRIFQSEIIRVMQSVDGVDFVRIQNFGSVAEDITVPELADLVSQLNEPFIDASLARANPAPANYPDDAILPAELVYLTPAVPETLILNEVTP